MDTTTSRAVRTNQRAVAGHRETHVTLSDQIDSDRLGRISIGQRLEYQTRLSDYSRRRHHVAPDRVLACL